MVEPRTSSDSSISTKECALFRSMLVFHTGCHVLICPLQATRAGLGKSMPN
jgi:hypothetical protein